MSNNVKNVESVVKVFTFVLPSQGVPQLGSVKQRWDGKNKSLYTRGCRAITRR